MVTPPVPESGPLRKLFQRIAPASFFHELCQKFGYGLREGIYSANVVVWLMIYQRLHHNRTLAAAVQPGQLSLDDPVAKYVTELQRGGDIRRLTLGQLASHTS